MPVLCQYTYLDGRACSSGARNGAFCAIHRRCPPPDHCDECGTRIPAGRELCRRCVVPRCAGVSDADAGDRCTARTQSKSGFCKAHRVPARTLCLVEGCTVATRAKGGLCRAHMPQPRGRPPKALPPPPPVEIPVAIPDEPERIPDDVFDELLAELLGSGPENAN